MDPKVLTENVLAILTPFLTSVGTSAAKKAGEALFEKIKKYFEDRNDQAGENVTDLVRNDPEIYTDAFAKFLQRKAALDQEFYTWLLRSVGDNNLEKQGNRTVTAINGSVAVGGNVQGNITVTGKENKE